MALYTYKAVDAHGKNVMGRVEAGNLFDLEQRLSRMDLDLISGAPSRQKGRLFGGGVQRADLINFCFHLEQLANAGVPVMEGLADLRESVENARFREVVAGLVFTANLRPNHAANGKAITRYQKATTKSETATSALVCRGMSPPMLRMNPIICGTR